MTSQMEVDESGKNVMASSATVGSVSLSLHPLVLMNISEHWTRIRAQEGSAQQGEVFFIYLYLFITYWKLLLIWTFYNLGFILATF